MITRAQITKIANDKGIDAKTIERDYVLTYLVALIAHHDSERCLALKGGTSLRLLHFEDYRYSADLDYSVIGKTQVRALDAIRNALACSRHAAIPMVHLEDHAGTWWLHYRGPLGAERSIKLDLSDDELVVNTELMPLVARWPDIAPAQVLAYTQLEIAAEKLRCVIQRFQCRDLLDLEQLLDSDIDLQAAAELFVRKARHKQLDPGNSRPRSRISCFATARRGTQSSSSTCPSFPTSRPWSAESGGLSDAPD